MKRRGFTLIELLIVIAIIAILAAILFPVFTRARENARRASCASNLKQIGLGVLQYTSDYDEMMPHHLYKVPGTDGTTLVNLSWRWALYPYTKSSQIYECYSNPERIANKDLATDGGTSSKMFPEVPRFKVSYAANGWTGISGHIAPFGDITGTPQWPSRRVSALVSPSTLLLVGEAVDNDSCLRIDQNPATSSWAAKRMFAGHLSTANMLFGDGHVKAMKWSTTCSTPYTWNSDDSACLDTSSKPMVARLKTIDTYYQ